MSALRAVVLLAALGAAGCGVARAEPFAFAAWGCLPYLRHEGAAEAYARLLAELDRHRLAFAVHLGDILGSDERADDAVFARRRAEFDALDTAVIYTPGDNEWTDTHSARAGGFDPLERLARLREIFFAEERSLGRKPIPLVTQRRDPAHARFVENARWHHGGVHFATVHLVGSANNRQPGVPGALEEWTVRDAANRAWLRAVFAEATHRRAAGVALFFQANPFARDRGRAGDLPGFREVLATLREEVSAFGRPVLLVHADSHRFRLDRGLALASGEAALSNLSRVETFGDRDLHGVLVLVDPSSQDVFVPAPLLVPGNALPSFP